VCRGVNENMSDGSLRLDKRAAKIVAESERNGGRPDDLLTEDDMCVWFDRCKAWFQIKRSTGGGPPFLRLGRSIRYRRSDVLAWLDSRVAKSTAEYESKSGFRRGRKREIKRRRPVES
jgi:hypothetical protein